MPFPFYIISFPGPPPTWHLRDDFVPEPAFVARFACDEASHQKVTVEKEFIIATCMHDPPDEIFEFSAFQRAGEQEDRFAHVGTVKAVTEIAPCDPFVLTPSVEKPLRKGVFEECFVHEIEVAADLAHNAHVLPQELDPRMRPDLQPVAQIFLKVRQGFIELIDRGKFIGFVSCDSATVLEHLDRKRPERIHHSGKQVFDSIFKQCIGRRMNELEPFARPIDPFDFERAEPFERPEKQPFDMEFVKVRP